MVARAIRVARIEFAVVASKAPRALPFLHLLADATIDALIWLRLLARRAQAMALRDG